MKRRRCNNAAGHYTSNSLVLLGWGNRDWFTRPLMYYFFNTPLGVSTGYGNLAKILLGGRKLQWIQSKISETWSWRVYFIIGIIAGAFLSARVSGMPWFTIEMGTFSSTVSWPLPLQGLYFFVGGIFLGLGARIATRIKRENPRNPYSWSRRIHPRWSRSFHPDHR